MAMAMANFPFPLLVDYLLASSWTWLALCLATIATLLRAPKFSFFRHRLAAQQALQPPPAIVSADSESPLCRTQQSSFPRCLQKTFKTRTRSKSTSALEKLHQNHDGFLRSGLGFLSGLLEADMSRCVRKVTSASRIFKGQSDCGRRDHRLGLRPDAIEHKLGLGSDALGLGFSANSQKASKEDENEALSYGSTKEQLGIEEDLTSHHLLPSWALSLCESLSNPLSNPSFLPHYGGNFSSSEEPPCFEKQFGWDKLLETRLGSPWQFPIGSVVGLTQCKEPPVESQHIVKVWSGQQKKLLKTLKIEESSALALDLGARDGLACIGKENGQISLWDIGEKACVSIVSSDVKPVAALSMNSEKGVTVAGNRKVVGLWDQKSSVYTPLLDWNKTANYKPPFAALKSRGNGLCIAQNDGVLSMYDLRKMHGEYLSTGLPPQKSWFLLNTEEELPNSLWERLACDVEEDFWDDCNNASPGNASDKSSSFMSWCAAFIHSLSVSVP